MSEEKQSRIEVKLSFSSDDWEKMKSALECYDQHEMPNEYIANKLKTWAYKSIDSNIRSIELQMKLKP